MIDSYDISDKRLALVIVDVQRRFMVNDGITATAERMLPVVNKVSGMFRRAGRPVYLMRFTAESGCALPPEGDGFLEGLEVSDGDVVVDKSEMSSFAGTGLEGMLRSQGVDGIVVCGLVARFCVLATYFGAIERDICPYILRGGTASTVEEHIGMVEAICYTVSPEDILGNRDFRGLGP